LKYGIIALITAFTISGLSGCGTDSARPLGNGDLTNVNDRENVGDRYNRNIFYTGSDDDFNYHGQMNTTIEGSPTPSYDDQRDAILAMRVTEAVEDINGVDEARAVISKDQIIVGVDTNTTATNELRTAIYRSAKEVADDRNVRIVMTSEDFTQLERLDEQVGEGFNDFSAWMRNIFNGNR
jgi:hypothetical protein